MPTEREKMLGGALYIASDPELVAARDRARRLWRSYNASAHRDVLEELLGGIGQGAVIEPPFFCDYGTQITLGTQTQLGPAVQLYTATHPLNAAARTAGPELAHPIRIGSRVWIGGGAIVLPGVEIGDDTVVAAGSVVTKSLPASVLAAGNPCRVRRSLSMGSSRASSY